jgi:hypothetical protein
MLTAGLCPARVAASRVENSPEVFILNECAVLLGERIVPG